MSGVLPELQNPDHDIHVTRGDYFKDGVQRSKLNVNGQRSSEIQIRARVIKKPDYYLGDPANGGMSLFLSVEDPSSEERTKIGIQRAKQFNDDVIAAYPERNAAEANLPFTISEDGSNATISPKLSDGLVLARVTGYTPKNGVLCPKVSAKRADKTPLTHEDIDADWIVTITVSFNYVTEAMRPDPNRAPGVPLHSAPKKPCWQHVPYANTVILERLAPKPTMTNIGGRTLVMDDDETSDKSTPGDISVDEYGNLIDSTGVVVSVEEAESKMAEKNRATVEEEVDATIEQVKAMREQEGESPAPPPSTPESTPSDSSTPEIGESQAAPAMNVSITDVVSDDDSSGKRTQSSVASGDSTKKKRRKC